MADFLVGPDVATIEERLRRVLETGRPLIFTEQSCRLRTDPGRERVVSVSAFRMRDSSSGDVLGVTQMVEDVTDRHRAQHRLAVLNRASARIGTTLDVAQTARELAEVAVPDLADAVSVDLLEPVTRGQDPTRGTYVPVHRTAVRSVVAEGLDVMYPVGEVFRFAPGTPQAQCLAEQQPILESDLGRSTGWYIQDPERSEQALRLGATR